MKRARVPWLSWEPMSRSPWLLSSDASFVRTRSYKQLQVYNVLTDTATSLVEFAREAQPALEGIAIAAIGFSLWHIQQARHHTLFVCFSSSCWPLVRGVIG